MGKQKPLYFTARAMSLGSFSRGNADFGRSALNVAASIGCGGDQGRSRYRRVEKCDGGYWRLMAARRVSGVRSCDAQIIDCLLSING